MNTKKLYIYKLVSMFLPESRAFGIKNALLRWAGAKIGKNAQIYSSTLITGIGKLEIGDDVFIGSKCILASSGDAVLKIGNKVNIGAMSYITTGTHLIDPEGERSCGDGFNRNVIIEDGAWLTVHIFVLPGVMTQNLTIGKKAMILGGSVVMSSIPERAMAQGNPAKVKGSL